VVCLPIFAAVFAKMAQKSGESPHSEGLSATFQLCINELLLIAADTSRPRLRCEHLKSERRVETIKPATSGVYIEADASRSRQRTWGSD
jgi:hypothetical protein